jgi:hypothetical protein
MADSTAIMLFNEIVPDATVRFAVINDVQYLSVRDLIMVLCGKDRNQSAEVWRRLPEVNKNEVKAFCFNYQFKGKGQQEQVLIQFEGAMKLLMWLPGDKAKRFRSDAAKILTRYYAGDKTLLAEVYANAEAQGVINQAARAALPQVQADEVEDEYTRKRKALELEVQEEALQMSRVDRHLKTVTMQTKLMEMYAALCPGGQLDDRTRLHFKDTIVNLSSAAAGNYPAITNGEAKSLNAPLTISTVAAELGFHFSSSDLISIGAKVSKLYQAQHGTAPPKHDQLCGGAVRPVCSYTERDRDIVERALREYARMREDEY